MPNLKLREDLGPVLDRYGREPVERTLGVVKKHGVELVYQELREMCSADGRGARDGVVSSGRGQKARCVSNKKKSTATGYVAKMELHLNKRAAVVAAATQFENSSFLPTIADIRYFWENNGLGEPAPKSRASAIPRVFSFISTMDVAEIAKMIDSGLYSGPTRLGPIADAIRGKSKERVEDIDSQSWVVSGSASNMRTNRASNLTDDELDENSAT